MNSRHALASILALVAAAALGRGAPSPSDREDGVDWGAPLVDLILLAPEARWEEDGAPLSFTTGNRAGSGGAVRIRRQARLEDGRVYDDCLMISGGAIPSSSDAGRSAETDREARLADVTGEVTLRIPSGARRLESYVGFPVDAAERAEAFFEIGEVRGGRRLPLGRVLARVDRRLDGLWCDVSSLAGGEHTLYLRVISSGLPVGAPVAWAGCRLTRGDGDLIDLLAGAPAARFHSGETRLVFGHGEGPGWVGWQRNVTMADGITHERVLATYPSPTEDGTLEAAFLATIPKAGARLVGSVGLPETARGGSAVRLELFWRTGGDGPQLPLGQPLTLRPGMPPVEIAADLTAHAGRTGHVVALLTIIGRVDRAWPTWCRLGLIRR